MDSTRFDTTLLDSQATVVAPVTPEEFDYEAYEELVATLFERCREFRESASGVLVYRRFRVFEVFNHGCRDMCKSLEWQLGGLARSLEYRSDVPNFIEPWYGIGTVASAYGFEYEWPDGQAPVGRTLFRSVEEALNADPVPVRETRIGKHTLAMIDYFLNATNGRLPMSLTDVQSPFNIACHIIDMESLLTEVMMNPHAVATLLGRIADVMIEFAHDQLALLGDQVVWPGHGFASSGVFQGMGMSCDNSLMVFPDQYLEVAGEADGRVGASFGGTVFHSCGDWSHRVEIVKQIPGLRAVDGAFTKATDPSPNSPSVFRDAFADTGLVVNARMVGGMDAVSRCVEQLWTPGLKLIAVTYCDTPSEQSDVYERIHAICGNE